MLVVNDFVTHIYRRAITLDCAFNDLDGAHDASAEATRLSQHDLHDTAARQGASRYCRRRFQELHL